MNPYPPAFEGVEVFAFPVDSLDRLGVPVWTTAAWTDDGVFCNGVGYGRTVEAAQLSAWGELAESWAAHHAIRASEPLLASFAALGPDRALDPRAAILPAGSAWTPETEMAWLPCAGGRLVPIELVATRFADLPDGMPEPVLTPITNGLGAGPHARQHGVRELIQRDGNSVSYRALDRGVGIDLDGLEDPVALELLHRYADAGVDVRVKLAGISCGCASVYVVGDDADPPHPLSLAATGEAAHPRRDLAVRKALLEFAAARVRRIFNHGPLERLPLPDAYRARFEDAPLGSEEDRSLTATREWAHLSADETRARLERIHAVKSTVALTDLPDGEEEDLGDLEVLWVPFDVLDGVDAGKAIVPGLEVESLSYGRVGPRNLARLVEPGVPFAGTGSPPPGALPLPSADGWLDPSQLDDAVGDLYALYREPGRHVVALSEAHR